MFGGNTALKIDDEEEVPEGERLLLQFARARRAEFRTVEGGDD